MSNSEGGRVSGGNKKGGNKKKQMDLFRLKCQISQIRAAMSDRLSMAV